MKVPQVEGVIETSLYVEDMPRSVKFYHDVLGFVPIDGDERITAMSIGGRQVLLLCKRGASKDYCSARWRWRTPCCLRDFS